MASDTTPRARRGRPASNPPARRPRGTGSIRPRGIGYTAYWRSLDPATGASTQQSRGGFATRDEAQAFITARMAEVHAGTYHRDGRVTVAQLFADHWLPVKRSENRSPNTIAMHEYAAGWVTRQIGGLRVESLAPGTVAKMVDRLKSETTSTGKAGLSPRSIQAAVGTLKAATAWAARAKLVTTDPLAEFHRPSLGAHPVQAWTAEQARTFLATVAEDRHAALWTLLLTRGLRRGELCGLKWDVVDLDRGELRVQSARVVVKAEIVTTAPKTGVGRTVPLDARLVAALRALRGAQVVEATVAADAYETSGYVMVDELGRPMHPDSVSRRFDALVTRAGLPRLTPHGLRHTCATLMLAAGTPTKVVSDLLGHASPTITLEIYAHTLPGMAEQAGENLSAALLDPSTPAVR